MFRLVRCGLDNCLAVALGSEFFMILSLAVGDKRKGKCS